MKNCAFDVIFNTLLVIINPLRPIVFDDGNALDFDEKIFGPSPVVIDASPAKKVLVLVVVLLW